jgi:hypothetical protein
VAFLPTKYFCQFSFIHINKTGGSSIEKALNVPLVHETALVYRDLIGEKRWKERFSFAIIRNPWDRAVSQFHYRQMINQTGLANNPLGFKEWLRRVYIDHSPEYMDEEKMFLTQADWVCDERGRIMVDYIGRFETLQQSWDDICTALHREKSLLPHVKKSSRGNYRDYYDDESHEIIASYFRPDIDLFDYSFD